MNKRKITLSDAKQMLSDNKDKTRFFDGSLQIDKLYEMFFGEFTDPEVRVIIAALRLTGARFNYE